MNKSQWQISDRFIMVLAVAFGIPLLAFLLIPTHPRPAKKALHRIRCRSEMLNLAVGFEKYKAAYQVYPATNRWVFWNELSGANSQKIIFANIKASSINTNGEYLDPWGMPFAIDFSPTNGFLISSAGNNKSFGDKDDIIFNSISNNFVKP